jgi:hypothetical protein
MVASKLPTKAVVLLVTNNIYEPASILAGSSAVMAVVVWVVTTSVSPLNVTVGVIAPK